MDEDMAGNDEGAGERGGRVAVDGTDADADADVDNDGEDK
jgi:hypothetical protein